jgi:hypothetical protein
MGEITIRQPQESQELSLEHIRPNCYAARHEDTKSSCARVREREREMPELLRDIFHAPPATLLVVFGLFFLALAIVGKISGKIDPGDTARLISGALGGCLLVAGLVMQLTSPAGNIKKTQEDKSIRSDATATDNLQVDNGSHSDSAVVFDFVASAPSATWTNSSGATILRWGGSDADPQGFALWRENAFLEDGSQVRRVLETHPQWIQNGRIWGDYQLPRPIRAGDRFKTTVGFLQGSAGEVQFVVEALGGALPTSEVARVPDKGYDRELRSIDADLGRAAGATIIRLIVEADPNFGQDWAVWINPRIEHPD